MKEKEVKSGMKSTRVGVLYLALPWGDRGEQRRRPSVQVSASSFQ